MEETPKFTYRKPPTVGPTVRSSDWTEEQSPSIVPVHKNQDEQTCFVSFDDFLGES